MIKDQIEQRLGKRFEASHIAVENESHRHNVPPDSETHFKVTLVSEHFRGKRPVARHQAVYSELQDIMGAPVHALALHTYTEDEWGAWEEAPDSPNCLGGSKR